MFREHRGSTGSTRSNVPRSRNTPPTDRDLWYLGEIKRLLGRERCLPTVRELAAWFDKDPTGLHRVLKRLTVHGHLVHYTDGKFRLP